MANVKVRLLRPLNGQEIGTVVEYDQANADRLLETGSIELVKDAKSAPENKAQKAAPENKASGKAKK